MNQLDSIFAFTLCTFILLLKIIVTNFISGKKNTDANLKPKEDYEALKIQEPLNPNDPETQEQARRWQRIIMNDLENIPIGILVFWISLSSAGENIILLISFIVFTVMRVLFSIFYAFSIQPWRTVVYLIALLSVIVGGVVGLVKAGENMTEVQQ